MKTHGWKSHRNDSFGRRLHTSKTRRRTKLALGFGLVAIAGFTAFGVIGEGLARGREQPTATPRLAVAVISPAPLPQPRRVSTAPAPAAPAELQSAIAALAESFGEPVGIAVMDVETGWTAQVNGDQLFPQQSVSKTWVALTVLDAVDRGQMRLTDTVVVRPEDRSVFNQPVAQNIGDTGFVTTIGDLLKRAIVQSDNAANDMLLRRVGGVPAVMAALQRKQLTGLRVGAEERDLQAAIAGLTWRAEYGDAWQFNHARDSLTHEVRDAALKAYLDNPADGASPVAIVTALAALKRGELLSPDSSALMLDTMSQVRTGPMRLRGGLPEGWTIAHKTGTGQDFAGASIGINDVALITAPDGRTYAVAVLIRRTSQPNPDRLAFMQSVTRAVAESWSQSRPASARTAQAATPARTEG